LQYCIDRQAEAFAADQEDHPAPTVRSSEYGARIIEAMVTNQIFKANCNVPNHGLIDNLPAGCCVERCLIDGNGIQPTHVAAARASGGAQPHQRQRAGADCRVPPAPATATLHHAAQLTPLGRRLHPAANSRHGG
jgi:hypothetical protein